MSWLNVFKRSKTPYIQPTNCVGLSYGGNYAKTSVLPDDYQSIIFCPQTDDVRDVFLMMACDVINQLLQPYYVVTHTLELIPDPPQKMYYGYKPPKTYASDYHRFFSTFGIPHAVNGNPSQFITQTEPGNVAMTALLRDEDVYCTYFTMYAYTAPIHITTFSNTLPLIAKLNYVFRFGFDLHTCGLSIIFDTHVISIDDLKRIIAEVCTRYGKTLDSDL